MLSRLSIPLLLLIFVPSKYVDASEPTAWAKEHLPELVQLYRHFHSHPELSFHEKETAARLAKEWKAVGAEVSTAIGGHGVVGLLKNGQGPLLMLRTDLDALPVTEQWPTFPSTPVLQRDRSNTPQRAIEWAGGCVYSTR